MSRILRRHIYSEHKSGPIGLSQRAVGGALAGFPIAVAQGFEDCTSSVWTPTGKELSAATFVTAATTGWTASAINGATTHAASINTSGIMVFDSGTDNTAGGSFQYDSIADCHPHFLGLWNGSTAFSSVSGTGSSTVISFRCAILNASPIDTGSLAVFGLNATDTSLISSAGALTAANSALFTFGPPAASGNGASLTVVSGAAMENSTVVGDIPALVSSSTTATWNNYTIRIEKAAGVSTLSAIEFYLNNRKVATHTSSLPTATTAFKVTFGAVVSASLNNLIIANDSISWAADRFGYAR